MNGGCYLMARKNNYLLGYGERLSTNVDIKKGGGPKNPPYNFNSARNNFSKWLNSATTDFQQLPSIACPHDQVTAVVTMHPRYVSKSDFPQDLFDAVGLNVVGGRLKKVKPRNWGVKKHPEEALTDEILVVGTRRSISAWNHEIPQWSEEHRGAGHLTHIEEFQAYKAKDKIRNIPIDRDEFLLEVVLHACSDDTLELFESYAKYCDSKVVMDRTRSAEGLVFVPVYSTKSHLDELANFSFIRVLRTMPTMRPLTPGGIRQNKLFPVNISETPPLDPSIRVAIFDGGVPDKLFNLPWVRKLEPRNIDTPVSGYQQHGLAVTSAFLFGPLEEQQDPLRPLSNVDHIRVLDSKTGKNGDFEYYDVLDRILETLDNTKEPFDFVNLSLGPDMPIDDDEVTRWTATLDERFSGGQTLATVAAGNSGQLDALSGLNRIQPPSDGVNALSIGASDSLDLTTWKRSAYSCVGPGRCPGIVKPDGVVFGGSIDNPFMVLAPSSSPLATGVQGTSFAAPFALRTAVSVRAQLGNVIKPLTIRALLIHRANPGNFNSFDVGWGRFETDPDRLITCDDDEVLVTFQGELPIKDYLRVPIPMPDDKLTGMIAVTATLVIAPEVDPGFPNQYTRGGLEVVFRPNSTKFKPGKDGKIPAHPNTKSFFSEKNIYGVAEYDLREEGHKWEPCWRATNEYQAKTLVQPCFDIYYHKRRVINPEPLPYALVVSVKAPKVPDFYDKVVRAYSNILVPLQPVVRIQVKS